MTGWVLLKQHRYCSADDQFIPVRRRAYSGGKAVTVQSTRADSSLELPHVHIEAASRREHNLVRGGHRRIVRGDR